jgi:hypothetical protein
VFSTIASDSLDNFARPTWTIVTWAITNMIDITT